MKNLQAIIDPADWDHIIVPVSSGKDSQAVLALAVSTPGVIEKMTALHQWTGYDHSATYAHLAYMRERYGVGIGETRSAKFDGIFGLIEKERYFPSSLARNCTSRLKIKPFADWLVAGKYAERRTVVLLGMRSGESQNRHNQYSALAPTDRFSLCDISKNYPKKLRAIQVLLPIVDWSTGRTFEFLRERGDKVNPLYAKGHKRVGCYPCLLAGDAEWRLAARDPEGQAHITRLVQIEDRFLHDPTQTRKLIRIHPTRDVRAMLASGQLGHDPFGISDDISTPLAGCAQCDL